MIKGEELTQIVKEVQEDTGQFELLYSQIINKVYFWCYTVAGDETIANDMSQEAIIKIYNKIKEVKHPEYFTSWMYRVVRNSCITYLRNNKKYTTEMLYSEDFNDSFEETIEEERDDNLPEEAYNLKETKELIRSFIDKLPRMQREVIVLYYLEEFTTTEIAETLNYNIGSVRSRLHSGRKNLEQQINDYQEKNNVKLYSTILLPLLGLILTEYSEELCSKQNLHYKKDLYSVDNSSLIGKLTKVLSSKLGVAIVAIIGVSIVALVATSVLQNESADKGAKLEANTSMTKDVEMFNKAKGHPYIKDITYLEFPMREGVNVTIELKKDISNKDIKILYNGKELSFERNQKDLLVQVSENGTYTIYTKGHETSFKIDNIDANAPELVEAFNENGYLTLIISDEQSQVNYEKSFIEYEGRNYKIPKDLKVKGEFHGKVKVTISHNNGDWLRYNLNFE